MTGKRFRSGIFPLPGVPAQEWNKETHVKHDLLASGSDRAPSRFFYIIPEGKSDEWEIPQWAGIMEALYHESRGSISLIKKEKCPCSKHAKNQSRNHGSSSASILLAILELATSNTIQGKGLL